jgi:AraC family transcriptional regulator of adaptative response/methylated-DNA-[protein]-cysteine methyltransferase
MDCAVIVSHTRSQTMASIHTSILFHQLADARWQDMTRNPQADGQFVYAVRTTGIYCRASCPSRLPKPKMSFFADGQDAKQQAFALPALHAGSSLSQRQAD